MTVMKMASTGPAIARTMSRIGTNRAALIARWRTVPPVWFGQRPKRRCRSANSVMAASNASGPKSGHRVSHV